MLEIDTYDSFAIFEEISPINPCFMREATRTLMRALPLNPAEPRDLMQRRMHATLMGLAAMQPRDEIEVMIGVQALCAYNAASANWHIGMNSSRISGNSLRNVAAAASAARTFDSLLRALERRQAKPLSIPPGRPEPRAWADPKTAEVMDRLEASNRPPAYVTPDDALDDPELQWTPEMLAETDRMIAEAELEAENAGLDIANTEGILPGGGMIIPEHPTPQQEAYLARRLGNEVRRIYAANRAKGLSHRESLPKIRHIKPGDLIE